MVLLKLAVYTNVRRKHVSICWYLQSICLSQCKGILESLPLSCFPFSKGHLQMRFYLCWYCQQWLTSVKMLQFLECLTSDDFHISFLPSRWNERTKWTLWIFYSILKSTPNRCSSFFFFWAWRHTLLIYVIWGWFLALKQVWVEVISLLWRAHDQVQSLVLTSEEPNAWADEMAPKWRLLP